MLCRQQRQRILSCGVQRARPAQRRRAAAAARQIRDVVALLGREEFFVDPRAGLPGQVLDGRLAGKFPQRRREPDGDAFGRIGTDGDGAIC